ncbi:MAG: DEAD/DEAH box helicase family protein [Chloroflexi bacterium]|nr:DEAD/DEAH box helicase family protein [Chloroflexota bacterium]
MSGYEVPDPIINRPFDEPQQYWHIVEGEPPELRPVRRLPLYYYRPPNYGTSRDPRGRESEAGIAIELKLVTLIRQKVKDWREAGYPGASRATLELLNWWAREGRKQPLFFAQREAAETIIFLTEARADFLQGISIPRDDIGRGEKNAFNRYACKMATGSGKTTVMGMLAAWSILNKLSARGDARFSDVVLVVCPNLTIRNRLQELDPLRGEASLYLTRDLVPPHLMTLLTQGRVIVTNWHVFEPHEVNTAGGDSGRVVKRGVPVEVTVKRVVDGRRQEVKEIHYLESDTALVQRVLGREVGGKKNILVMNDEAHHAYRIRQDEPDEYEDEIYGEAEEAEEQVKEATVWIDGLDKIHRLRGINICVDLSATPYYLNRVGQEANRPFPWVVSDFGLQDAIEAGMVKIPQLAVRDSTGAEIPAYFNVWRWIMEPGRLTPAERGGSRADPKPEAVLKWAHTPISQLGGLWEKTFEEWQKEPELHPTPPVFIIVCKTTKLAKVIFEWLADGKQPPGIAPPKLAGFRNHDGQINTIRVDTKVIHETDTEGSKSDEDRWMRFTLDTVGKTSWPTDSQGRPQYPPDFEALAEKLKRPLHPPGRDVRCIVSVGFLTEGWDCTTVTHIVGLRPFLSQLLCEQVVGRGLRRTNYDLGPEGKFTEEIARIYGVPFEIVPFKTPPSGATPRIKRYHVHAIPEKQAFEIVFPRLEGYTTAIRNRVIVNWDSVPPLMLDPTQIPTEVEMKAGLLNNKGRHSLSGPGRVDDVTLREWRAKVRVQELEFDLATGLARDAIAGGQCDIPAHVLFPQMRGIVRQYLDTRVERAPGADLKDLFLSPYYGWLIERLTLAVRGDDEGGAVPELPRYEISRGPGSTREVDFWTSREVREVNKSHLNYVVADTQKWEQSAAFYIDKGENVVAFAKNTGLGFAIPYLHNGQMHDYVPDFLARLQWRGREVGTLILETKGYDELAEVKRAAAERWIAAVNADGRYGKWIYRLVRRIAEVEAAVKSSAEELVE